MKYKFWIKLFLPLVLGTIVGILINNNIDYNIINKPPLSLSASIFPIVWTIIYLLIGLGYALYDDEDISLIYYLQLGFNLLWSIIFFTLKLRFLSILWIIILDILVIILFIKYLRTNKLSAYLLLPYLLWIIFATYLNIGVYILN